jgi:DNA-binding MarR family transcriptional regulator
VTAGTSTNGEPLAFVVVKLGRLVERRLNRAGMHTGLTASQLLVLSLIARRPGSSRADVARGVHLSPQAVSGLLTQLLNAGMITRTEFAAGQPLEFSITDDGGEALDEAEIASEVASKRALDAFRTDHRAFIDGVLGHLLRSLELDGAPATVIDRMADETGTA